MASSFVILYMLFVASRGCLSVFHPPQSEPNRHTLVGIMLFMRACSTLTCPPEMTYMRASAFRCNIVRSLAFISWRRSFKRACSFSWKPDICYSFPAQRRFHYTDVTWASCGVINRWQLECLFNTLFKRRTKKHQRYALLIFSEGNPLATGASPPKGPVMRKAFSCHHHACFWLANNPGYRHTYPLLWRKCDGYHHIPHFDPKRCRLIVNWQIYL